MNAFYQAKWHRIIAVDFNDRVGCFAATFFSTPLHQVPGATDTIKLDLGMNMEECYSRIVKEAGLLGGQPLDSLVCVSGGFAMGGANDDAIFE